MEAHTQAARIRGGDGGLDLHVRQPLVIRVLERARQTFFQVGIRFGRANRLGYLNRAGVTDKVEASTRVGQLLLEHHHRLPDHVLERHGNASECIAVEGEPPGGTYAVRLAVPLGPVVR